MSLDEKTDLERMPTVLELAREVRHRLVSRHTGCLTVDYPEKSVSIHFCDGTVAPEGAVFLSCFTRNPVDFQFRTLKDRNPGRYVPGSSLLIEAIEAIDQKFLIRIWEQYADCRIVFRLDEDLHNTFVKQHLSTDSGLLRRLMRLAVSGSATIEPPTILIADEMDQIEKAFTARRWRDVLGVTHTTDAAEIKQAYRKLARRFHPDRWVNSADMKHRDRIERTFQHVSRAYIELHRPTQSRPVLMVGPKPKKSFWEKMSSIVR
jgi:hypothetical protein